MEENNENNENIEQENQEETTVNTEENVAIEPEIIQNDENNGNGRGPEVIIEEKKEQTSNDEDKTVKSAKEMAIVSLVSGIIGVVICCCSPFYGLAAGVLALVMGILSYKKAKSGMAIAGIILAVVSFIIFILAIIAIILLGTASFMSMINEAISNEIL